MVHLQVQVANTDAAAVTRCIAKAGLLHLVDIAHGRSLGEACAPETRELLGTYRAIAHRIRRLAERLDGVLPEPSGGLDPDGELDLARERFHLEVQLAPLEEAIGNAWRRYVEARERAANARQASTRAERLQRADIDVDRCTALRFTTIAFGVAASEDLAVLAASLAPAPFAIVPLETVGTQSLAAVVAPASGHERLNEALRVIAFEPVPLPGNAAAWDAAALAHELQEAAEAERQAADEIAARRKESLDALAALSQRAEIGVLLLQAQTCFAAAGRFVVISGWIPAESAEAMRQAILSTTEQRAVVDIEAPENVPEVFSGALRVPILHRNPLLLRPFQKLVQLYGIPSYHEIEPTAFFALSFLLMFGLMFGDIGHGLVLFSAGFCLFRYFPRFLDYGILLMEGGVSSVLFGTLYGSFFGISGLLPILWMEPIRDIHRFMSVAVGLGVVLVSGGLILNTINTWRSGQRTDAVLGPHGLFGAFLYWVTLALIVRALVPRSWILPTWALVLMLCASVVVLLLGPYLVSWFEQKRPGRVRAAAGPPWLAALEASVEIVDTLFSYFANTISFVRVAAFAAVHAGVFIALFALADTVARLRFGGLLSIVSLVAGNIVIIFLEGLTVSVQVLRLEYYEFFGKFFRGGGEPYRPLMLRPRAQEGGKS